MVIINSRYPFGYQDKLDNQTVINHPKHQRPNLPGRPPLRSQYRPLPPAGHLQRGRVCSLDAEPLCLYFQQPGELYRSNGAQRDNHDVFVMGIGKGARRDWDLHIGGGSWRRVADGRVIAHGRIRHGKPEEAFPSVGLNDGEERDVYSTGSFHYHTSGPDHSSY